MSNSVKTTCPYCGVGCGVIATPVANGKFSIKGDPEHPANFGRLCSKGAALGETLDLEGRLLQPELNGERTDWDTALALVASKFRRIIDEHGPDAVAFYVSGQLLTEDYYVANKLMKGFIGSANIDTNSRLCMSSAVAAHKRAFGADIVPCSYDDLEQASLIILTGSNTAWCHPVIYQRIVKARKENPELRIVVIDPRTTATCDIADLHLPLAPGSDAILFNGLLRHLARNGYHNRDYTSQFTVGAEAALAAAKQSSPSIASVARQCALERDDVEQFFELFCQNEKVVTLFSQGINQSTSGTDKGNAIINCHLLTGRIGRPGMGPFSITGQPNAMGGREVGGLANQLAAHMELENPQHRSWVQEFWQSPTCAQSAGLKATELFRAVEEGKIKALWIMATNPVVSMPDADRVRRALSSCDFLVVSDNMSSTDTSALADLRLPALGWGEKDGTVTNSERCISRQRAFLPPPGEAKPDWWMISEVARRLGFSDAFTYNSPSEIFSEHARLTRWQNNGTRCLDLGGLSHYDSTQYDQLTPVQWPVREQQGAPGARLFHNGHFFTNSGRARLIAVTPRDADQNTSRDYPLLLNTGRVRDQWHTMTRSGKSPRLSMHTPEPFVSLHASDAQRYGIEHGNLCTVASAQGSIVVRAEINEGIPAGQLFAPIHWNDQFSAEARVGALIATATDPVSGQPESKHTPVRLEPYPAQWYGFLLSRRRLHPESAGYWSLTRGKGLWRYQLAGKHFPESWSKTARRLLCTPEADAGWIEYFDSANKSYRAARIVDDRIESCLYISATAKLPDHEWIEDVFLQQSISSSERIALLAGKPTLQHEDNGATICACYGVGSKTIRQAILDRQIETVEAITDALKAGGNCGSCLPELKNLLNEVLNKSAA